MKQKYKNNIIIIFLIILLITYIKNSPLVVRSILSYTELFMNKLFPASFIFFVISSLLIDYGFVEKTSNLFNINGANFYVVIMSIISGFPSGSKYIKDLYNKELIDIKTANYLITFTHFPNPIFILGSVSLLFKNTVYATYILISLVIANLIIGIILRPKNKKYITYEYKKYPSFSTSLSNAIINSIKTMVLIYGVSIFFYLIITIISKNINLSLYKYIFINGMFDLTKGVFLTSLIKSDFIKSLFIILFISFGGLSINMQVKSIISDTPIRYSNFLIARVFQFIISVIIFLLIVNW